LSLYFFWHHHLAPGLATHFVPPIAVSLALIAGADLEPIKSSRAGAYLKRHMTRTVEAIRFAGDIAMVFGAWFYLPSLIILGLVVIVIAWCGMWVLKPWSNYEKSWSLRRPNTTASFPFTCEKGTGALMSERMRQITVGACGTKPGAHVTHKGMLSQSSKVSVAC
jgi:hypothetical protein